MRIAVKPFEENTTVVELLNAINGGSTSNPKLAKVATELKANAGKSLVITESNDTNVQLVVNAINQALGTYGTTISFTNAYKTKQGSDKSVVTLIEGLNSGAYKGIMFSTN